MSYKPSSPPQSARGHAGLPSRIQDHGVLPMPCPSWGRPSPDTLPAWTRGCPQLATPSGIPDAHPPPLHCHPHPGPSRLQQPRADALGLAIKPRRRLPSQPVRARSGVVRTPRANPNSLRSGLGPEGSRLMAPKKPLFSGLGRQLRARSDSEAASSGGGQGAAGR